MRAHYYTEMHLLRKRLEQLGRSVMANVRAAATALIDGDSEKAQEVLHAEQRIDHAEVRVEEECLKLIALHQPVADDLRFLVGVLKSDHELERIGDLAASVAALAPGIAAGTVDPYRDALRDITNVAGRMVEQSVESFLNRDAESAKRVWQQDDDVDDRCDELATRLRADVLAQQTKDESRFELLVAVTHLERIADHAASIAQISIYDIRGHIVRHRQREFRADSSDEKIRVLFVCVHNSARSQMAAAWLNHLHGDRYEAESAGLTPGALHPLAVQVMHEAGIDISANTPRDIADVIETGGRFDYAITVCDAASAERCPPVPGIAEQIQWSFDDPATFDGSDAERLEKTRRLRDRIRARVEDWARVPAV